MKFLPIIVSLLACALNVYFIAESRGDRPLFWVSALVCFGCFLFNLVIFITHQFKQ